MILSLLIWLSMYKFGLRMWKERKAPVLREICKHERELRDWGISPDQVYDLADSAIKTFNQVCAGGALVVIVVPIIYVVNSFVTDAEDAEEKPDFWSVVGLCFLVDVFWGLQGALRAAKVTLVNGIKRLVSQGSWTGWFLVNIFPVDHALSLADVCISGTPDHVIHLAQWLLNDSASITEGVCIGFQLVMDLKRGGLTCGCCGHQICGKKIEIREVGPAAQHQQQEPPAPQAMEPVAADCTAGQPSEEVIEVSV